MNITLNIKTKKKKNTKIKFPVLAMFENDFKFIVYFINNEEGIRLGRDSFEESWIPVTDRRWTILEPDQKVTISN